MNRPTLLFALCASWALAGGSMPAGLRAQARPDASRPAPDPEAQYRANNLGVALLEQFNAGAAADAFRRALAIDAAFATARINLAIALYYVPDSEAAKAEAEAAAALAPDAPQPQYLLGLIARADNRADDALAHFDRVLKADPRDVGANVNRGQVLLQLRRYDEALASFQAASAVEPYNVTAAYNLGVALTRAGRREEGARAMEKFQQLRDSGYKTQLGQTYLEQGRFAEAIATTGAEADLVDPKTPAVTFEALAVPPATGDAGKAIPESTGKAIPSPSGRGEGVRAVLAFDPDNDADLDLLESSATGLRLLRNDKGRFVDATKGFGLDGLEGAALAAVAGDYDNDGKADLFVLREKGLTLYHNEGGRFTDATAAARIPARAEPARSAAFLDVDHDGDVDLFVAGYGAPHLLLRNDGNGAFSDVTAAAGLAGSSRKAVAVAPTDFDNRRDLDLLVVHEDAPPALFKNMRDGTFKDVAADVGLGSSAGLRCVAAADLDKDGFTDFFFGTGSGPGLLALSDGRGAFTIAPAPAASAGAHAASFFDYDLDGVLDLVTAGADGVRLFRSTGSGLSDVSAAALAKVAAANAGAATSLAVGDLTGDGRQDIALGGEGGPRAWASRGGSNRALNVRLAGLVSNKGGIGAKVELRAGSLRQKLETSSTAPAAAPADVVFGLGRRERADAVRVLWTSGILQTETELPAAAGDAGARMAVLAVTELDRKPSSCPYLYAWDGRRFAFVTDFLGGGEMGYSMAPGVWNVPDPEEYVRIPPGLLQPRDGRYELRVTNELEEVLFLDRAQLVAVAHPEDVAVFPTEGMTSPARPFRLLAVRDIRPPRSAVDDRGRDVRERLAALDGRHVDGFPLRRIRGYAEDHALVLDLGDPPERGTVLLLTGWTDYAFSSDNVAAHQAGVAMKPPSLEVRNARGEWETKVAQVGIPVGRPQTIALDLSGLFSGPDRRVRIVTNMRIYWDEVGVGRLAALEPRVERLDPARADLRERGFSEGNAAVAPEPLTFDYQRVSWTSPWKTMTGRYTRPGDVRGPLGASDDVFVISRPGDEVALSFDASALPPLPAGWTRTFLLHGDGFSKEMDINSASPDAVLPLPYHGMSRYPYPPEEAPAHVRAYTERLEREDTRVVVRPLQPLELAEGNPLSPMGRGAGVRGLSAVDPPEDVLGSPSPER
jgi:lipoprotein NlpI